MKYFESANSFDLPLQSKNYNFKVLDTDYKSAETFNDFEVVLSDYFYEGERVTNSAITWIDGENEIMEMAEIIDWYLDGVNEVMPGSRDLQGSVEFEVKDQNLLDYEMNLLKVDGEENYWVSIAF